MAPKFMVSMPDPTFLLGSVEHAVSLPSVKIIPIDLYSSERSYSPRMQSTATQITLYNMHILLSAATIVHKDIAQCSDKRCYGTQNTFAIHRNPKTSAKNQHCHRTVAILSIYMLGLLFIPSNIKLQLACFSFIYFHSA